MYCSLGQNQFFDDAGAPLSAGRVKIYAKGSDTLLPIYVDGGDSMVSTQNPVITANDGRIPTIFWPAALVDVVVEKSNGDGTYTELDSYVAGLDISGIESSITGVDTISDLRNLRPVEGDVVWVYGYYIKGDCPARRYIATRSYVQDDGGYFIKSIRYSGGWYMLWDNEEYLPASVYGVMADYGSHNSNVENFFAVANSYDFNIGYKGRIYIFTPPTLLFDGRCFNASQSSEYGNYRIRTQVNLTTEKYVSSVCDIVDYTAFAVNNVPIIHCRGYNGTINGRGWGARWLFDQCSDVSEERTVDIKMFSYDHSIGYQNAFFQNFLDNVALGNVKYVRLSWCWAYQQLDSSHSFEGKIVLDRTGIDSAPAYGIDNAIVIYPNTGKVWFGEVTSDKVRADRMDANKYGFYVTGTELRRDEVPGSDPVQIRTTGVAAIGGLSLVGNDSTLNLGDPEEIPVTGARKSMYYYDNVDSLITIDLTRDTSGGFQNSRYYIGDVVTFACDGSYATGKGLRIIYISGSSSWDIRAGSATSFLKVKSDHWVIIGRRT